MSASVLILSNDLQNTDATLPIPQNHDLTPPIRRSSGRRKGSKGFCDDPSAAAPQKKKTPQRGMGVEKLERLRIQERLKKMAEISPPNQGFGVPLVAPFSDPPTFIVNGGSHVPIHFSRLSGFVAPNVSQVDMVPNQGCFHGLSADQFQTDLLGVGCGNNMDFLGKNVGGVSRELSSTPNVIAKCFSEHCNICHKKNKVNGENLGAMRLRSDTYNNHVGEWGFLGLNIGDNQNIIHQETQQTLVPDVGLAAIGHGKPGVEVVAVHRKGSSSEEGGSEDVLMEYEFFPSAGRSNNSSESEDMKQVVVGCSETCSSLSMEILDASSSIDLSLKLSY